MSENLEARDRAWSRDWCPCHILALEAQIRRSSSTPGSKLEGDLLARFQAATVQELQAVPASDLVQAFGERTGHMLSLLRWGKVGLVDGREQCSW